MSPAQSTQKGSTEKGKKSFLLLPFESGECPFSFSSPTFSPPPPRLPGRKRRRRRNVKGGINKITNWGKGEGGGEKGGRQQRKEKDAAATFPRSFPFPPLALRGSFAHKLLTPAYVYTKGIVLYIQQFEIKKTPGIVLRPHETTGERALDSSVKRPDQRSATTLDTRGREKSATSDLSRAGEGSEWGEPPVYGRRGKGTLPSRSGN